MAQFYTLAKATTVTPDTSGFSWPCEVSICFDQYPVQIVIAEGVAHGAAACTLTPAEALEPKWASRFADSQGEWLLPFIRRMANGEPRLVDDVLAVFRTVHGHDPESYKA